jgi:hypothetical protein
MALEQRSTWRGVSWNAAALPILPALAWSKGEL